MSPPLLLLALLALLGAAPPGPLESAAVDPQLSQVRNDYEFGKYEAAVTEARARILREKAAPTPNPALLVELHKYAGVAAYTLGRTAQAEAHLLALLQLDPDYALDPFVFPPPSVNFLEKLKRDNARILDSIREARKERLNRERKEAEGQAAVARERKLRDQEEQRRRVDQLTRVTTVKTVERHSYLVNFIPFGAGQFQQGRPNSGVLFAAFEGLLAATSIASYLALQGMIIDQSVTVDDRFGTPDRTYPIRGIPKVRESEANRWRIAKLTSGIGFYGLYAYGVVDALLHHQDVVEVGTEVEKASASPAPPPAEASAPVSARGLVGSGPEPFLFPARGGMGAGVTLRF